LIGILLKKELDIKETDYLKGSSLYYLAVGEFPICKY